MIALLIALATPQTAVGAERAFAEDAQTLGQWTAFRKWAADDAILFLPKPSNAQTFLKPLKDPPRAVEWRPADSYVSCDGTTAANTGPTRWPDGRVGYFSTIWRKTGEAWKWTVDHGDFSAAPRWDWKAPPSVRRASCEGEPTDTMADVAAVESGTGGGSEDGTLRYAWIVEADGARSFAVRLWNGSAFDQVITDTVAAPPKAPKP